MGKYKKILTGRGALLFAFALAVMADPVSSVAYAIEAALRSLNGDLSLLLPTMGLVVGIITLIIINYHQLVARYPEGGGAAAAAGEAFGEAWAFVPIGALVVDFVLTIAISVSAGASALIAYFPTLASYRIIIALFLLLAVAGLTWFGHIGRAVFATMTVAFVIVSLMVLTGGIQAQPVAVVSTVQSAHPAFIAILLAFPVAMALATGVEAPSSAIAQLGQLDNKGRKFFGRVTLWLTLATVGLLTIGFTFVAVKLGIGIPQADSTQIADIARVSVGSHVFAAFQFVTALLLLAAASSSFQAGPGLLKALARKTHKSGIIYGVLHPHLGRTNHHHTPYFAVAVFLIISALVVLAAGAKDQELVLFYAVSVFVSFFIGLMAMARFAISDRKPGNALLNGFGALVVGFTLVVNLSRGDPIISLVASLLIAAVLYALWVRAGRPKGISQAVIEGENVAPQS
ncbi:MAG: amino acid permease [Candidatus Nomurabacteria bacterium]|nr:MAG: amino acid permease [Candidatus Nomurabacteria bacterium]